MRLPNIQSIKKSNAFASHVELAGRKLAWDNSRPHDSEAGRMAQEHYDRLGAPDLDRRRDELQDRIRTAMVAAELKM